MTSHFTAPSRSPWILSPSLLCMGNNETLSQKCSKPSLRHVLSKFPTAHFVLAGLFAEVMDGPATFTLH